MHLCSMLQVVNGTRNVVYFRLSLKIRIIQIAKNAFESLRNIDVAHSQTSKGCLRLEIWCFIGVARLTELNVVV